MFNIIRTILLTLLIVTLMVPSVFAQEKIYEGPEDSAGDPTARKIGYMEGNAIRCQFANDTELSDWGPGTDPYATKWPNDLTGSKMNDGIGLLIGAKVYIESDNDTTTVDSMVMDEWNILSNMTEEERNSTYHPLYFLQTNYRERMDMDPLTETVEWGLHPSRGYANDFAADTPPAMASKPNSWPSTWPSKGFETKWDGQWNGRFGANVFRADEESYVVANDAQDQEYLQDGSKFRYYPRPGRIIGALDPNMSKQVGMPWGGIGVRVEMRGFQWNNAQSRDAIFWEYSIQNMTEYNLTQVAFGYWVDNAIGDDGNDEYGAYDLFEDLAYSWDTNGIGTGSLAVGTMGFAYLESPGNSIDQIDNDQDGIIDEKRENQANAIVGPYDGIADLEDFKRAYQITDEETQLREHWDADEDQDWDSFSDDNGNGIWDEGEDIGDDVGLDGLGPAEIGYVKADEGEGDGKPSMDVFARKCEPDFGITDVTESDMLGLTAFHMFPIPDHTPPYTNWFENDSSMWALVGRDTITPFIGNVSNLAEVFATGVFPLFAGNTERISMSQLHSWDDGNLIEPGDPVENPPVSLFNLKKIVQIIYERDYRFAMPPLTPKLTATEGDGFVLLTWDNNSEINTRDPFVGNENDFEGYKLYKSTDRNLTDAIQITDGYGNRRERVPVFQCDLKDDIQGFATFGLIDGMGFYLGDDRGISHSYRDNNVQNGRTYYYALVAYDYGIEDIGVRPTENNFELKINTNEKITYTSKNVAVATPHADPAGYVFSADAEIIPTNTYGSGSLGAEVLAKGAAKNNTTYKVKFEVDKIKEVRNTTFGVQWVANGINVYQVIDDTTDVLVYNENPDNPVDMLADSTESLGYYFIRTDSATTDIFDGIRLTINTPVIEAEYDYLNSGWLNGSAPVIITETVESAYFPWDYNLVWTTEGYTSQLPIKVSTRVKDEDGARIDRDRLFGEGTVFPFYVENLSIIDPETGENVKMEICGEDRPDENGEVDGIFDINHDRIAVGTLDSRGSWAGTAFFIDFSETLPEEMDALPADAAYAVRFIRPFFETDSLMFTIKLTETTQEDQIKDALKDIKVVPNPYVATNAMEPALANKDFNQRRRIMFTHVPNNFTIRIFTSSGVLVDTITPDAMNSFSVWELESGDDSTGKLPTGTAYWDVLTKDGLEVAAGMYIWHITAEDTGDERVGKLAIIK